MFHHFFFLAWVTVKFEIWKMMERQKYLVYFFLTDKLKIWNEVIFTIVKIYRSLMIINQFIDITALMAIFLYIVYYPFGTTNKSIKCIWVVKNMLMVELMKPYGPEGEIEMPVQTFGFNFFVLWRTSHA